MEGNVEINDAGGLKGRRVVVKSIGAYMDRGIMQWSDKIWKLCGMSTGLWIAKWLTKSYPKILMYHRFDKEASWRRLGAHAFEKQIRLLLENCNVIRLRELVSSAHTGKPLPPNSIVITIDDGYEDFYTYAFPILKKYQVPATIYVTTGFIDKKIWMWPDLIDYVLRNTTYKSYSIFTRERLRKFHIAGEKGRRRAWNELADYCLTLDEKDKQRFLNEVAEELRVNVPTEPIREYKALSWWQIEEMIQYGVDIGCHTKTHPRLTAIAVGSQMEEIRGAKNRIEEITNVPVDSFAYPNGTKLDYDEKTKSIVREAGYKSAVVAYTDGARLTDMYELRRYSVGNDINHFRKIICGIELISTRIKSVAE